MKALFTRLLKMEFIWPNSLVMRLSKVCLIRKWITVCFVVDISTVWISQGDSDLFLIAVLNIIRKIHCDRCIPSRSCLCREIIYAGLTTIRLYILWYHLLLCGKSVQIYLSFTAWMSKLTYRLSLKRCRCNPK